MGEIHELFVLALPLVWFAGATPDKRSSLREVFYFRNFGVATSSPSGKKPFFQASRRQNPNVYQTNSPEFEVGNGKNYWHPKKSPVFQVGDLASKSLLSADTQRPLSVNLAKLLIQNSEEFEVGNVKNYQHPKISPIFFSWSVTFLVRMVDVKTLSLQTTYVLDSLNQ